MNNNETLANVVKYNKLKDQFSIFCKNFSTAFPSGNEYGLEIDGSSPVERELKILDHTGKIELGFNLKDNILIGIISFYRVENKKHIQLCNIYFDKLGNYKSDLKEDVWLYSFNDGLDYTNNLSRLILNGFFSNPKP